MGILSDLWNTSSLTMIGWPIALTCKIYFMLEIHNTAHMPVYEFKFKLIQLNQLNYRICRKHFIANIDKKAKKV